MKFTQNRLRKEKDFEKVFKKGFFRKSGFFVIRAVPNDLGYSRFGFIVGKKNSKKAVWRNKTKRILRETIRNNFSDLRLGLDVVVSISKNLEKEDFSLIRESFKSALSQSGILKVL